MLLVAKVRAGGHGYYLEPTGADGRVPTEAPGQWVGRGAPVIGLMGQVAPEDLAAVLSGTDPRGTPLPGADRGRVEVLAFDLTFCAPKSVSLVHALADSDVADAVGVGHRRAVAAGIGYLEDHALAVRRPTLEARRVPVRAEGTPAAAFVHRTSRARDPHLHTHVVTANVGRGSEGSWSALDGRGLYAHATAAGALYHAQLRHELTTTLGVAWGPLQRGRADISGIGPEVRRAFSRRSEEIATHLAARGLVPGADGRGVSRRAARVAGLTTRMPKELDVTVDELRPEWQERARSVGLGPLRLEAVLDCAPRRDAGLDETRRVPDTEVAAALAQAGTGERAFTRRDVVRAWSGALPQGGRSEDVAAVVDRFLRAVSPDAEMGQKTGVAEPRIEWPEHLRRRELEVLLERRGMVLEPELGRRGRDRGADIGLGLG